MLKNKLIIAILSFILTFSIAISLLLSNNYNYHAIALDKDMVVGSDARMLSYGNNVYIVSSTDDRFVLSKVETNKCTILLEINKEPNENSIQNFYDYKIIGNYFYIIYSFKTNKFEQTTIKKYSITSKDDVSEATLSDCFIRNSDNYTILKDDTILLLKNNKFIECINIFNSESEDIEVNYVNSIKSNLTADKACIIKGIDVSNPEFVYLSRNSLSKMEEHDAGDYPGGKNYRFISDNLIFTSENKFYELSDDKFKYKFNSNSNDNEAKAAKLNNYIITTMGSGLLHAIDINTNKPAYELTLSKEIMDIGADDSNLFVLYKDGDTYYIESFSINAFKPINSVKLNSGINLKTKSEINSLYSQYKPINKSVENIYSDFADFENFTTAGHLNKLVLNDGLNAINFYRELYGFRKLELDSSLIDSAMYGSVLALLTEDLTKPEKPQNMNDETYNKSISVLNKNCISKSEQLTNIPLSDAVHYLFNSNCEFRERLLDSDIKNVGIGACSDRNGKTAVLVHFEDREKYSHDYNFIPYPCEGSYPFSLVDNNIAEFSISLGESISIGDKGDISVTITNLNTSEERDLSNDIDFEVVNNRRILIKNIGFDINKESKFKINVDNLLKSDGLVAGLEYSINLFELKSGDLPVIDPDNPDEPKKPDNPEDPDSPLTLDITSDVYNIDKKNMIITNVEPGTTVAGIKENIKYDGYSIKVINYKNKEIKSGIVGTSSKIQFYKNDKIIIEFHIIIYGDLTGEGNINSRDLSLLENYLLDKAGLSGYFLLAANVKHHGDVNICDYLIIKRHINGEEKINQKDQSSGE